MTRPLRPVLTALAAALAATVAAPSARAADTPLFVPVRPAELVIAYAPASPVPYDPYDGQPILPLAVLSGPGYGLTGRDYYFDQPSEHALRPPRIDRRAYHRAAYR